MHPFLQSVVDDPCGGLTAAAVVLVIGNCAVGGRERCRQVGAALGGIAFLVTLVAGFRRGRDPLGLTVAALVWGGLLVGAAWICLPILTGLVQALYGPL